MDVKALDLFNAYKTNQLPENGGYIISSFLQSSSRYARYEIVAYASVKNLYVSDEGITFQADGNKIFILVEPDTYPRKYIEPVSREGEEQIPHRFSELSIYKTKNQTRVMVSTNPIMTYSSFTIMKPTQINFAFIFFNRDDVFKSIHTFFDKTLNKEAKIQSNDSNKAADIIVDSLQRFTVWTDV